MSRSTVIVSIIAAVAVAGIAAWYVLSPGAPAGADADNPARVALGKRVYAQQCASCHGVRLEGQPDWRSRNPDGTLPAPPHDASGHTWHHPDGQLFDLTRRGGQASAPPGFVSAMPGFGAALTDKEIWASLAYIKSRWPRNVRARQAAINERAKRKGR